MTHIIHILCEQAQVRARDFAAVVPTKIMPTGIIKKWFEFNGYGFITPDYGRTDVFVHRHGLLQSSPLPVGAPVRYEVEYNDTISRWLAVRVQALGSSHLPPVDQRQIVEQAGERAHTREWWHQAPQEPPFQYCA